MRTVFSLLIALFLVSTLNITTSNAQDSAVYMYWTDVQTYKIQRANLDGTNVQDLVTTELIRPDGITLDVAGGKMYWTGAVWGASPPLNKIQRANLDGTDVEDILTNVGAGEGIAVDSVGKKLYWLNVIDGKIQRANLDGTNIEDLITTGLIGPTGIALDVAGSKMYWTDRGTDKIQRANLDGTNIEDLIVIGLQAPINIALDLAGGKMYWTDWEADKIQRANLDGTNVEDLITTGLIGPDGLALHLAAGKMYWADWGTSSIRRANLDGTNVENLVTTGLIGTAGIALGIPQGSGTISFSPSEIPDQTFTVGTSVSLTLPSAIGGTPPYAYTLAPSLPVGLSFDPIANGPGYIGGTPIAVIPTTPFTYTATDATGASASSTFTITVQDTPSLTDAYMYWAAWSLGRIRRANLNGTNLQDLVSTGLRNPRDIALDIAGHKMYWVDAGANKVQRANLDGSNVEDLVNTQGQPFGVAIDAMNGKLYWSTWNPGKIRCANLDGTNIEDFVTGLSEPEDIDLDLSRGKIYWTDTVTNKIQRANLDGSNIEDLVTVGLSHPLGIALDVSAGKMYWTNTSFWGGPWPVHDKIQRANLDGTNVEDLVTTELVLATGIALDVSAGKMYWTNANPAGHRIQRANLDGSNVEDVITGSADAPLDPSGLALSIPQTPSLHFDPNMIADQNFTVGTDVSLTLPIAIGGTSPYTYTLAPTLPSGLYFDPIANGPGYIGGTPTAVLPATPFTYTATDATGASASLTFTITVEVNLDVNGDGRVDVLDLVWVAVSYGMRGGALPADVNADGIVNVTDLVAVAGGIDAAAALPAKVVEEVLFAAEAAAAEFKGVPGAPMGFNTPPQTASGLTVYSNIAAALADAKHLATGDVRLGKWLPVLEELLHRLTELGAIPETTALLPNYPNPFNPETWIPYHLAQEAEVTLTIYDVRGSVVHELTLGHQPAGVYESRGRAAYWDGKNQIGEKVASGLYFYTLTAGDFTATRKLLIAK